MMRSRLFPSHISHGFGTKTSSPTGLSHIVTPTQTHSNNVHVVTAENLTTQKPQDTDGLVTNVAGVAISVVTADCIPILFVDPVANIVGIAHAGWRGILSDIVGAMISIMLQQGAKSDRILTAIGPAIGPCCYPIYGERKDEFHHVFGTDVFDEFPEHTGLNLTKAAYLSLVKHGIKESRIDHPVYCTSCQKDMFWSYRRDGTGFPHMVHFIELSSI